MAVASPASGFSIASAVHSLAPSSMGGECGVARRAAGAASGPQPFHHVGEYGRRTHHAVAAFRPVEGAVVACELKRRGQNAVGLVPRPEQRIPAVAVSVLEEDPYAAWLRLAHKALQPVGPAHRHERAAAAVHPPEEVRPLPRGVEGRYAAAAQPEYHGIFSPRPQRYFLAVGGLQRPHGRQQLRLQEAREAAVRSVELIAAVVAQHLSVRAVHDSGLEIDAYHRRNVARGDKAVYALRSPAQNAVESHVEACARLRVIVLRNRHLECMYRGRIVGRVVESSVEDFVSPGICRQDYRQYGKNVFHSGF